MVDFGGMKDKAEEFVREHDDQIRQGVDKVGDFVGDKIGHDKVDGVTSKINDALDNITGEHHAPAPDAAPAPHADQPPA